MPKRNLSQSRSPEMSTTKTSLRPRLMAGGRASRRMNTPVGRRICGRSTGVSPSPGPRSVTGRTSSAPARYASRPSAKGSRELLRLGSLSRSPEGTSPVRWFATVPQWVTSERPEGVKAGEATDGRIMAESVQLDAVLSALEARPKGNAKARVTPPTDASGASRTPGDGSSYPNRTPRPGSGDESSYPDQTPAIRPMRVPRFMPLRARQNDAGVCVTGSTAA
jgi:hypothetical protein